MKKPGKPRSKGSLRNLLHTLSELFTVLPPGAKTFYIWYDAISNQEHVISSWLNLKIIIISCDCFYFFIIFSIFDCLI